LRFNGKSQLLSKEKLLAGDIPIVRADLTEDDDGIDSKLEPPFEAPD
jgi:hypothetical protein